MSDHSPGRPRRPDRPLPPHAIGDHAPRRQPQVEEKRSPWQAPRRLAEWPVTSCGCDDCKDACLNSPGWFLPEELDRLADYLNLTLEALFQKHLAVSTAEMPDGSKRHGVMPHKLRDHKKPGQLWTLGEVAAPGRCVFFDHGKCTIYPVRPFECARVFHSHRKELRILRVQVVERWTREALRLYEDWVGHRLFPKHLPAGPVERGGGPAHRGRPRGQPRGQMHDGDQSGNRRPDQASGEQAPRRPGETRGGEGGRGRPGGPRGGGSGGHPSGGQGGPGGPRRGRPGPTRDGRPPESRGRRPDHEGEPEVHPDFAVEPRGQQPPRPGGRPGDRPGGRPGGPGRRGRGPGRPTGGGDD